MSGNNSRTSMWWLGLAMVLAVLSTGCVGLPIQSDHTPSIQMHEETSVGLNSDNFILVKPNVVGESEGFSLFGIILMYPPTLDKAMGRMYAAAAMPAGRPQTVSHLIIETSSTYWVLFSIPKVQVRADVVEFVPKKLPEGAPPPP